MSGQVSRGSAGEYQADERAGVARLICLMSGQVSRGSWSIFDVFKWNVDNDGYTCNYPLWFIWALLWIQIIANYLVKWVKSDWTLFLIGFAVSLLGYRYIKHHGNPLQYSCLENPMDRVNLVGCSPVGRKESDMTEGLSSSSS